jgi:CRP-like cAMP-binding protein
MHYFRLVSQESKLWYLENFSMMSALSKTEMMAMDKMSAMKNAPKNQIIYFPEDTSNTLYMLKEGKVKISKQSPDGKEIILAYLHPGEVFGELSITGQEKREEIAEATEDAVICVVDVKNLHMMMEKNAKFNFNITKLIGFKLKKIQNRLESMIFKSAEQRVSSFIKELAMEHGKPILGNAEEKLIQLKLTHDDIAKLTATSRQTVTSTLNLLEKKNIIDYDRRSIFVKALSKL